VHFTGVATAASLVTLSAAALTFHAARTMIMEF
jgi:hypothetical protein